MDIRIPFLNTGHFRKRRKERKMTYQQQRRLLLEQQAREQRWSARQAQRQMQFQERMSSTAHQREVADLQAAGLNPVLSAGGSGAQSANGAMAEQSSIIPELTQLLQAANSGRSGGSPKVVINNEQPETPSEYFSARQFKQGINAGQGAYHGSANAVNSVKKRIENAREEMREAIKNINISGRVGRFTGGTISAKGEDITKVLDALKKYNNAVKSAGRIGLHNHASSEKYYRDLRVWFKELKSKRVDPELIKKAQEIVF